ALESGQDAGSGERQDLVTRLGHEDCVLKLCGACAVFGDRRPAVRPHVVFDGPKGEHRLDGESHSGNHLQRCRRIVVMRDDQSRVERAANSVPGEVANDAVMKTLRIRLDHSADDIEAPAGGDSPDASHHRLMSTFDKQPGLCIDGTGEKGGIRVAVYAIDVCGDIDVDDVTVIDQG